MKNLLKIYSLIVVLVLLVSMLFIAIPWENLPSKDFTVVASFVLNGLVWGLLLFYELTKRAYSLLIIHWLFCFLFFFCIAFAQYMYGIFPLVVLRPDDLILETNLFLLAWTVFVWAGYHLVCSKQRKMNTSVKLIRIPLWLTFGLTSFTLVNTVYRVITVGFAALLSRATAEVSYGIEASSASLLITHMLQAIAFFATIFAFVFYKQTRQGFFWVGVTLVCLLISYFPTALSRNATATIYGGLLLIACSSLRKNRVFIVVLLSAFLIVLPFLNAFRSAPIEDVNMLEAMRRVFEHLQDDWLAGDYDAYVMLTLILEHIQFYGITWGRQLLGVFLFWVPRSVWFAKPIGTGAFVSTQLGWDFTNLSAPLPAEGLINFGWMGLLVAIVLGKLMKKLDETYWERLDQSGKCVRAYDLLYPVLIMFFFFMNRGDLLSSFAFTMAYVTVWWLLCKYCKQIKL